MPFPNDTNFARRRAPLIAALQTGTLETERAAHAQFRHDAGARPILSLFTPRPPAERTLGDPADPSGARRSPGR